MITIITILIVADILVLLVLSSVCIIYYDNRYKKLVDELLNIIDNNQQKTIEE